MEFSSFLSQVHSIFGFLERLNGWEAFLMDWHPVFAKKPRKKT
jgi:hypothetical protein